MTLRQVIRRKPRQRAGEAGTRAGNGELRALLCQLVGVFRTDHGVPRSEEFAVSLCRDALGGRCDRRHNVAVMAVTKCAFLLLDAPAKATPIQVGHFTLTAGAHPQEVIPANLRQHFQVVEVSAMEAGKAMPEIAGGLRGGLR